MGTVNAFEKRCHGCRGASIVTDAESGETVCTGCGVVMQERTETGLPEVYSPKDQAKKSQDSGPGAAMLRHDMGLSTIIGKADRDASGKPLEQPITSTVRRMRKLDGIASVDLGTSSSFIPAFYKLNRFKDNLVVSDAVAETAARIYRKAWKRGIIKHRHVTPYIAAALYAACKYTSTLRTMENVARVANISPKKLQKSYNNLVLGMDMKMPRASPIRHVARIADNAGISWKTRQHAVKVLNESMCHVDLCGRKPISLAAAALYLSCVKNGEDKTQQDIAKAADCSHSAVWQTVKILNGLADSQTVTDPIQT